MFYLAYLTFAQIITVLHENLKKNYLRHWEWGWWGGGGGGARTSGPYAYGHPSRTTGTTRATWLYTKIGNRQRRLHANQA